MQPRLLNAQPNHTGYLTIYMHHIILPTFHHILYSLSQKPIPPTSIYYTSHIPHIPHSRLTPIFPSINNPNLQVPIRLLQIIIHNNNIMHILLFRKLHFRLRLLQPLLQTLFILSPPTPQSFFQNIEARWREEEETGVEVGALDLFDTLRSSAKEFHIGAHHLLGNEDGSERGDWVEGSREKGDPTSISISKMQIRPFSAMSLTASTLVP